MNSTGIYTLTLAGSSSLILTFTGGTQTLYGMSIYDGYGNQDNGTYLLKDGIGNTLGGWSISGTPGNDNNGVDSFWLTFNTPVTTNSLVFDTTAVNLNSYREIQVFGAPEPASALLLLGSGAMLLLRRRRPAVAEFGR